MCLGKTIINEFVDGFIENATVIQMEMLVISDVFVIPLNREVSTSRTF